MKLGVAASYSTAAAQQERSFGSTSSLFFELCFSQINYIILGIYQITLVLNKFLLNFQNFLKVFKVLLNVDQKNPDAPLFCQVLRSRLQ